MKKFLLIQSRPEDEASDDEYRAFIEHGGLKPEEVERVRAEKDGIPEHISLDNYAGVIIGGGPFNATDPDDKKSPEQKQFELHTGLLLDDIIDRDMPCLAACYGVGIITEHQGGVASTKYSEDVAVIDITLTQDGEKDPLLEGVPKVFKGVVGHHEACETLPSSATLLATGEACPVQMMRIGKNVYVTQFHPELDDEVIRVRLTVYRDHGYFKPEEAENLIRTLTQEDLSAPWKILKNFVDRYRDSG